MNTVTVLLAVIQALSALLIVDRTIALYIKRKPKHQDEMASVQTDVVEGNISNAIYILGTSTLGDVIITLDENPGTDFGAVDTVLLREQKKVEARIGYLAMLGNAATMIGLMGTIGGMIRAFSAAQSGVDPEQKRALLQTGLEISLYSVGYGLAVALPALVAYAVFQNRANVLNNDLGKASLRAYVSVQAGHERNQQRLSK